jgi:hypothetical protein
MMNLVAQGLELHKFSVRSWQGLAEALQVLGARDVTKMQEDDKN